MFEDKHFSRYEDMADFVSGIYMFLLHHTS